MTNGFGTLLLAGLVAGAFPAVAEAQRGGSTLGQATIEELMDIRVTSAARKSQRAEDVAAAMYVITRDDIRRSGLGTLPEILRLAPGVQVAQISASKWAISIRGFNDVHANKLLVLIDGRSVYSRSFSGVFWDMHDLSISDIDRIEIVRGPGGVTWGANAVNGVINIMTRTAMATQGLALDVSAGTFARERVGVRYGGTFGTASYRVFSQWSGYADGGTDEIVPFADNWHSLANGFRTDWSRGADAVLVQGHFTTNKTRPGWLVLPTLALGQAPATDGISHGNEASVLGRWTRTRADGTVLQVQAYHTRLDRDEPILHFRENSSDIELQYETRLASRHSVVLGGGFRHVDISTDDTVMAQMGAHQLETMNLFVQDEIAIRRDLALTFGVKVEHDTFVDLAVLPTARMVWEASPRQRVWAAASRAHRTPSITDRDFRVNVGVRPGPGLPIVVAFFGNPEYAHEELVQTEVGYRVRLGSAVALDVTAFRGLYDGLATSEPLLPAIETTPAPVHLLAGAAFANLRTARASGIELNAHWMPLPRWQIEASYAFLDLTTETAPASLDTTLVDGNSAAHHFELRSTVTVRPGVQAGASVSRVGRLNKLLVPAYTRMDARLEWRLNSRLTAAAVGQNLLTGSHQEFGSSVIYLNSGIPRSARLDLRWEF